MLAVVQPENRMAGCLTQVIGSRWWKSPNWRSSASRSSLATVIRIECFYHQTTLDGLCGVKWGLVSALIEGWLPHIINRQTSLRYLFSSLSKLLGTVYRWKLYPPICLRRTPTDQDLEPVLGQWRNISLRLQKTQNSRTMFISITSFPWMSTFSIIQIWKKRMEIATEQAA